MESTQTPLGRRKTLWGANLRAVAPDAFTVHACQSALPRCGTASGISVADSVSIHGCAAAGVGADFFHVSTR